jgi:hypothetical protein
MIAEPTVLVLGAGASMPFGFPSGAGLKSKIVSLQDGDSELMRWLLASGFSRREIVGFAETLGMSLFTSVDRFLEFTHGEFRKIGCAAIATDILLTSQQLATRRDHDWMRIAFDKLAPEMEEQLYGDRLVVVTYNYDCSFEFLLWRGLKSAIRPLKRAHDTFGKIRVIHLHGRIAPTKDPWEDFPVEPKVIQDSFNHLDKGVVPSHERNPSTKEFEDARKTILKAKRVCFLGFGYDSTNLERLRGDPKNPSWQNVEFICGSAHGRTENENQNVNQEFFGGKLAFGGSDWDASRVLREFGVLEKICTRRS